MESERPNSDSNKFSINLDVNESNGTLEVNIASNTEENSINIDINKSRDTSGTNIASSEELSEKSYNLDATMTNDASEASGDVASEANEDSLPLSEDKGNNDGRDEMMIFQNVAALKRKMGIKEMEELMETLIKRFNDLKRNQSTFIDFMKEKKQAADLSYKRQNTTVAGFSAVSAAGGLTMIVGAAGVLLTVGASFALVLAGGITVGIGTFGSITTQIVGKVHRRFMIRQVKKELKKIESDAEELNNLYTTFCSKCEGVCNTLEALEISMENLKHMDPIIFKFAMIGWFSASRVAIAAGATTTTTEVVRSSSTAAHIGKFLQLKFLGKTLIPTLKITQAVLGIGMAISGLGVILDLYVGGKAVYDLATGKECAESKNLSRAIAEADKHIKVIDSYVHLLEHDAAELLKKADQSTKNMRREIEQLKTADQEKTAEIEQLKRENEAQFKNVWDVLNKLQK